MLTFYLGFIYVSTSQLIINGLLNLPVNQCDSFSPLILLIEYCGTTSQCLVFLAYRWNTLGHPINRFINSLYRLIMSGLEFLVIPALISSFVSALNDGRGLLQAYKQRHLRVVQSREANTLHQSLTAHSTSVQSNLAKHMNQFGDRFKKDCQSVSHYFLLSFRTYLKTPKLA